MESPAQKRITILTNAAAVDTKGVFADATANWTTNQRESTFYVEWTPGTSAGQVTIETAHDVSYTGGWAEWAVYDWTDDDREDCCMVTGVAGAARARITGTIVGGTGVNVFGLSN